MEAAAACTSLVLDSLDGAFGSNSAANRVARGNSSCRSPSRLAERFPVMEVTPVRLPPVGLFRGLGGEMFDGGLARRDSTQSALTTGRGSACRLMGRLHFWDSGDGSHGRRAGDRTDGEISVNTMRDHGLAQLEPEQDAIEVHRDLVRLEGNQV